MSKKLFMYTVVVGIMAGVSYNTFASSGFEMSAREQAKLQAQIVQYKGISLDSFIRSRFTGFYNVRAKVDKLASHNRREQKLSENYFLGKPLRDGSFVNYAPYNASNTHYIEKPKQELAYYCRVNNGVLRPINYFSKNIIKSAYVDPVKAYLSAKASLGQLKYRVADLGEVGFTNSTIEALARKEYNRAEQLNEKRDIYGSTKGYMKAMRSGAFGEFTCLSQATNNPMWKVSITPLMYKPSQTTKYALDALYIGINPHG